MKRWTGIVTDKVQQSKDFQTRVFACEVIYEGASGWIVGVCPRRRKAVAKSLP